jgi:hypothetical protein
VSTAIFKNKFFEFNFILFPLWIGVLYVLSTAFLSISVETIIFLFFLFFGQTHFAAAYLFYLDKSNHAWIKKNYITMIIIPLVLLAVYVAIGLKSLMIAILVGNIASWFHVTRQSIGVQRLYGGEKNDFFELCTYFFSFLFIFIAFLRFGYNELINVLNLTLPQYKDDIAFHYLIIFAVLICFSNKGDYKKKFTSMSGVLIFAPYAVVPNPYDAAIIGVGAHWCQYLAISYKVYFKNFLSGDTQNQRLVIYFFIFVVFYTTLMTSFGYSRHVDKNNVTLLMLIPMSGEFIHYYIDAFIWRFSDSHIRKSVGGRLFS